MLDVSPCRDHPQPMRNALSRGRDRPETGRPAPTHPRPLAPRFPLHPPLARDKAMVEIRQTEVYARWFRRLRDRRLSLGNPGDVRPVGEGVSEIRIDYGPGYRVYFAQRGEALVVLLAGGDKDSQERDRCRLARVATLIAVLSLTLLMLGACNDVPPMTSNSETEVVPASISATASMPTISGTAIEVPSTPTADPISTPTPRLNYRPLAQRMFSVGGFLNCGLRTDGNAVCWGDDRWSQSSRPQEGPFESISSGGFHACAVRLDGSPACWGYDEQGQSSPPEEARFMSIASGGIHSCGLRHDGTVVCWGYDEQGQSTPPEGERFASLSGGYFHTCGLRYDGRTVCWGINKEGQSSPPEDELFVSMSSGHRHTCGLRHDGSVLCWGSDDEGQSSPPEGERFSVERAEVGVE